MAITDTVKRSIEGDLLYNLDYSADENVTNNWVPIGYVTDLNFDEDPNSFEYHKKFDLQPAKKGIPNYSGSMTQWFTNTNESIFFIAKQHGTVALRIDIHDDDEGAPQEQLFLDTVNLKKRSFKAGDLNGGNDAMSTSVDFSYNDSHKYQPA